MLIREILPDDHQNFDQLAPHLLQSFWWNEFKQQTGVESVRLGKFAGKELVEDFAMTIHPLSNLGFSVGYVPRAANISPEMMENLFNVAQQRKCLFVKLEPNILSSEADKIAAFQNSIKDCPVPVLPAANILPQHTFFLDLKQTENEILRAMHEKTRYNIKVAQKHEVTVRLGENLDDLQIFLNLQRQTAKRQNFQTHSDLYFIKMFQTLKERGMFYQLIAEIKKPEGYNLPTPSQKQSLIISTKNTIPLSSIILLKFKNVLYYPYGGSAFEFREKMPNHLIHWKAIQLGKQLNCNIYDLWGCLPPNPNPKDNWFGFHRFKEGFGGKLISYLNSYDIVFNQKLYGWFNYINKWRFKLLKLKNRLSFS